MHVVRPRGSDGGSDSLAVTCMVGNLVLCLTGRR
jgi:hypothetical protein